MPVKVGVISISLISTLLIDSGLSALAIAHIVVTSGIIAGTVMGFATYTLSKPNNEKK